MALKPVIAKLEDVDQALRLLYVQSNGKFVLDVAPEGGYALENVEGLRSALSAEREAARQAKEALKVWGDLDPAKARDAVEKVGKMASWTPEEKVREQIKAREDQLLATHKTERDTLVKERDGYQHQLERQLVDASAVAALAKSKGNVALLLPHVRQRARVAKDEKGELRLEVLNEQGQPAITLRDGAVVPMGMDELVEAMKKSEVYSAAFEGSGVAGSGATGPGIRRGPAGQHVLSWEDGNDPAKYRVAKEAAAKAGVQLVIAEQPATSGA